MKKKTKKMVLSCASVLILAGAVAPSAVTFADSSISDNPIQEVEDTTADQIIYVSNTQILENIKLNNPDVYATIPSDTIESLKHQDMLRQGTTRVTTNKNGFKIYLNSAIVKSIKYGGIGVAGATLTAIGVVTTAATFGLGTFVWAGGATAVMNACLGMKADRGVIVSFSKKGSWVSTQSQ